MLSLSRSAREDKLPRAWGKMQLIKTYIVNKSYIDMCLVIGDFSFNKNCQKFSMMARFRGQVMGKTI